MKINLTYLFILFLCPLNALIGQEYTIAEKNNGYAIRDSHLIFIFDAEVYNVSPQKVVVTGAFRGWSQDMGDEIWQLEPDAGKNTWLLEIENVDFKVLKPLEAFKFRIDNGRWLDPPATATNTKGGNLILMHEHKVPKIKVELLDAYSLWLFVEDMEVSLIPEDYLLKDWKGQKIPLTSVLPNTASKFLLHTSKEMDYKRVHFLEYLPEALEVTCSFDGWFRNLYSNKPLGANISENGKETTFAIFAPRMEMIKLYLYKSHEDEKAYKEIEMDRDQSGVWEFKIAKNLAGIYYDFTVHGPKEPGSHSFEVDGGHISDPYARANVEAHGKSKVMPKTRPAKPLKNGIPKLEDVIAYEVHVQDFTDQLPVEDNLKGTIPAMTVRGLKNKRGESIGFEYLLDLGINTLHLMPMQEYLHFPDDQWKASFQNDQYMIDNGVNEENYQWGYRTTHCFAVENKYRQKDTDYGAEREQFRDLVQAFHDENIAVIIDIVPNHTGENMDGSHFNFHFNALDKLYYYRTKDFDHIGAFW